MSAFTADRVTGPEPVQHTHLVVFYVEIGDGRRGRAFVADRDLAALCENVRAERVCAALNSLVDSTSEEEVVDQLTAIRGIYLRNIELQCP
jgi:hypothetical protein